jgi:RecA-family ATPase
MAGRDATEVRLAMLANGYDPIATNGKCPVEQDWPSKTGRSVDQIKDLETRFPNAKGSGFNNLRVPSLDGDITDHDAADTAYSVIEDWFGDRGRILRRGGNMSKFMVPLAIDAPMAKIVRKFKAPNGDTHQIEARGDGQQSMAFGYNPDAKRDYFWANGWDLTNTARSELPLTTEKEVTDLLNYLGAVLAEQFNWAPYEEATDKAKTNGHSAHDDGPFDPDTVLAAMQPNGASVEEVQRRVILSWLQRGEHPQDILERVVDATMEMADRAKIGWTRAREHSEVVNRITRQFKTATQDHWQTRVMPPWLPGDFHESWLRIVGNGGRPALSRNGGGWYLRATRGPADAQSNQGSAEADGHSEESKKPGEQGERPKKAKPELFVLRPFVPFDPASLPPRQWLYGRHYLRQTVSATVAPGGYGKSTLDMIEGIAMATCRNLLGEQPEERLRVWFHNGEEPLEEMRRRVAAICQHYNIPQDELVGWFFMTSGHEVPLRVAEGYTKLEINDALIARISDQIRLNRIDVAIFDPLITLHGVPETDNTKMDQVIRIFASIADENRCAIELSHHVRKGPSGSNGDYGAADIRGATAIHDAIRGARMLNHMSDQDARDLAIELHHRAQYFRVDKAKGNYSPAAKAVWRQFVSVEIANGDDVGVITTWDFPGHGEATPQRQEQDRKADFVFLQLIDRFTLEGRTVSDRVGANYAPARFAKESEAKLAGLSNAVLAQAMRRLFEAKKVKAVDEGSGGKATHKLVRA